MKKWARNIKIKLAIIAANNHYAAFGPGTVNIFRGMLGLSEAKWKEKEIEAKAEEQQQKRRTQHHSRQLTLTDFLT